MSHRSESVVSLRTCEYRRDVRSMSSFRKINVIVMCIMEGKVTGNVSTPKMK